MTRRIAPLPSPDFARTGLIVRPNGTAPTRFQVLGERSSGTNLVTRLLARNSAMQPCDLLGWKHGFVQAMAIPVDLAVICVVRNAADWALSMHAKPWHTVPEMQVLDFSGFIRAPWATIIDRPRYFGGAKALVGQPLQQDRDPSSGEIFDNLFALRRAKLASLLGHLNRDCTCALLRLEEVQASPESTIAALLAGLGQKDRSAPFRPIVKRLGMRFKPAVPDRPATPSHLSPDDLAFLRTQIDPEQEHILGYDYG